MDEMNMEVEAKNVKEIETPITYCKQEIIVEKVIFPEGAVPIRDPRGMFAKSNGEIVIADAGVIYKGDKDKLHIIRNMEIQKESIHANSKIARPIGLWVSENGEILLANTYNNQVVILGEEKDTIILGPDTLKGPRGITKDKHGNLFICDSENNRILKYSVNGQVSTVNCGDQPTPFNLPTGLCVLDTGEVIVADCENNCIQKIDQKGNVKVIAGKPKKAGYRDIEPTKCYWPYNIRPLGEYLVFVEAQNNSVRIILKSGRIVSLDIRSAIQSVKYIRGLAITNDYHIYISGIDNNIFRIRPKPNYATALMIFTIYMNENIFQTLPKELILEIIKMSSTNWDFNM